MPVAGQSGRGMSGAAHARVSERFNFQQMRHLRAVCLDCTGLSQYSFQENNLL
jgi:hypothetical protein